MTREQAHQILDRVRAGRSKASQRVILRALQATGDVPQLPIAMLRRDRLRVGAPERGAL